MAEWHIMSCATIMGGSKTNAGCLSRSPRWPWWTGLWAVFFFISLWSYFFFVLFWSLKILLYEYDHLWFFMAFCWRWKPKESKWALWCRKRKPVYVFVLWFLSDYYFMDLLKWGKYWHFFDEKGLKLIFRQNRSFEIEKSVGFEWHDEILNKKRTIFTFFVKVTVKRPSASVSTF